MLESKNEKDKWCPRCDTKLSRDEPLCYECGYQFITANEVDEDRYKDDEVDREYNG
jgi:predicted amidophosphoribosyltransferase